MIKTLLLSFAALALAGSNISPAPASGVAPGAFENAAHAEHAPLHTPNPVFNNFGSGHSYWCCSGGNVAGDTTSSPEMEAAAFTPAVSQTVHHISVALGLISGDTIADVFLYADSSGLPGNEIAFGVVFSGLPNFTYSNSAIVTVAIPATLLAASTQYWVVVGTDSGNMVSEWNYSPHYMNPPGPTAYCLGGINCTTWAAYSSNPANQAFALKVY